MLLTVGNSWTKNRQNIRGHEIRIRTVKVHAGSQQRDAQDESEKRTEVEDTKSERDRAPRTRDHKERRTRDADESTRPSTRRSRRQDDTAHRSDRTEGKGRSAAVHENTDPKQDLSHSDDQASYSSDESIEVQEARYRYMLQYYDDREDWDNID